jgi:cell wall-associated NlpC family hydrolase
MYRLRSALSAVSLAAGVAVVVSIFVVSAGASPTGDKEGSSEAQYAGRGTISTDSEKGPGPGYYRFYDRWSAEDSPPEEAPSVNAPSQGSEPRSQAPAKALSIMKPPTPYSQVVDNASSRKFFSARGEWKKSNNRLTRYGKNYRYVRPAEDMTPAWFKVRIPTDGFYTVYARWPAAKGNNPKTRFQISTASGTKKVRVNQRRDGGIWMRLGAYKMNAGNRYSVRVAGRSKAEGRVVADAVMVVAGTQAAPQAGDDGTSSDSGAQYGPFPVGGKTTMDDKAVDSEVIESARTHLGTPYVHSPPMPCTAYLSEDCSCFTSLVFSEWVTMPDNPVGQWYMGEFVEKSDLLPGDLVFFKEAGPYRPITHVGIYSGRGNIIHSSTYWGQVVESQMNAIDGYYGARRLT